MVGKVEQDLDCGLVCREEALNQLGLDYPGLPAEEVGDSSAFLRCFLAIEFPWLVIFIIPSATTGTERKNEENGKGIFTDHDSALAGLIRT